MEAIKLTVSKHKRRERKIKNGAELVRWRSSEIIIDAVLQNPDDCTGENKECKTTQPEISLEGFEEDPCILAPFIPHRHHHRQARCCIRQCEISIL